LIAADRELLPPNIVVRADLACALAQRFAVHDPPRQARDAVWRYNSYFYVREPKSMSGYCPNELLPPAAVPDCLTGRH
jgi:hypothetical protein